MQVVKKTIVKLTENFERNLEDLARFLAEADASQAYDGLLDELLETVIPNLERFPDMGRPFLHRPARSVETTNAQEKLRANLLKLTPQKDALREYAWKDYLLLYALIGQAIYLLAVLHHRQISFDFSAHWKHA